jgi:DNA-binding LacI/PurR family transcriptional regulator
VVGIREVAKETGFSTATVSYALSGKRKISDWKVKRIREVAAELNYSPNIFASGLKSSRTNIVGVYIENFEREFYGDILNGIERTLDELGYGTVVVTGPRSRSFLSSELMDGAIMLDLTFSNAELLQHLDSGHKMVILDRELEHENARTVLLDNTHGSQLAYDYLVNQEGCDALAVVTGPDNFESKERLTAFAACAAEDHRGFTQFSGDFERSSGYALGPAIVKAMGRCKHLGIYFFNDEMAIGFHSYAEENDVDMVHGLTAIGFDKTLTLQLLSPHFASIGYRRHLWGSLAATSITQLIEGKESKNLRVATSLDV